MSNNTNVGGAETSPAVLLKNYLALIGAVVVLISLFLPVMETTSYGDSFSILVLIEVFAPLEERWAAILFCTFFIVIWILLPVLEGVLVIVKKQRLLLIPAILSLVGVVIFLWFLSTSISESTGEKLYEVQFGLYISIIGAVLVLAGWVLNRKQ